MLSAIEIIARRHYVHAQRQRHHPGASLSADASRASARSRLDARARALAVASVRSATHARSTVSAVDASLPQTLGAQARAATRGVQSTQRTRLVVELAARPSAEWLVVRDDAVPADASLRAARARLSIETRTGSISSSARLVDF